MIAHVKSKYTAVGTIFLMSRHHNFREEGNCHLFLHVSCQCSVRGHAAHKYHPTLKVCLQGKNFFLHNSLVCGSCKPWNHDGQLWDSTSQWICWLSVGRGWNDVERLGRTNCQRVSHALELSIGICLFLCHWTVYRIGHILWICRNVAPEHNCSVCAIFYFQWRGVAHIHIAAAISGHQHVDGSLAHRYNRIFNV